MKITRLIYLIMLFMPAIWVGCETDDIEDLTQINPVVVFDSESYNATIVLTDVDNIPEIRVRLMGKKQQTDVVVSLEIDAANTTVAVGSEFTLDATTVTIPAGESYAVVPFTIDRDVLEADVSKKVALNIVGVSGSVRKAQSGAELQMKKTIIDVGKWLGEYTYFADGWERDMTISSIEGENYKVNLYNFWGNGLDMEATIDLSDPYTPKVVVAAGALLSWGWNNLGDWYLENDLIGVMDGSKMEIVFTQFDYITDDGTTGSYPWCAETCKMVKN